MTSKHVPELQGTPWDTISSLGVGANTVLYSPKEPVVTKPVQKVMRSPAEAAAYEGSFEQDMACEWFGSKPPSNGLQWDVYFEDSALFKHGNNGIYVDPKRDFCAMNLMWPANTSGVDYAPDFMRAAAILFADE